MNKSNFISRGGATAGISGNFRVSQSVSKCLEVSLISNFMTTTTDILYLPYSISILYLPYSTHSTIGSFCGDLGIGPFIIDPENGIFRVAPCFQDTLTIIYISFFIIILGGCLVASRNTNHISSGTLDHSSLDKDEEPVNQSYKLELLSSLTSF